MHNVSIVISRKHKSSPSHIRCQLIDLIQIIRNYLRAYTGIAQISFNEFVRPGISKFVLFYVNAGHPITFCFQPINKMPADKPSCSANQCFFHIQNLKPKYINNKKICSEFFSGPLLEPSRRQQRLNDRLCRSEEHTSELQSLMRISYAVFCLK